MLDVVEKLFKTRDVYAVLNNISAKDAADPKRLRAAYLKTALAYHPDKVTEKDKDVSTQKFQVIAKIYEVLKDDDSRKSYEETGIWPEEDSKDLDYNIFSRLDENTILEFKKYYQGSEEEINDVKKLYEAHKGNVFKIIDNLFCASILDDIERIESIISDFVKDGSVKEIPRNKSYNSERKRRIAKAEKEAAEAEEMFKEIRSKLPGGKNRKLESTEDLHSAIMERRQNAGKSFLDNLEAKYSSMEKEPKSKKPKRK